MIERESLQQPAGRNLNLLVREQGGNRTNETINFLNIGKQETLESSTLFFWTSCIHSSLLEFNMHPPFIKSAILEKKHSYIFGFLKYTLVEIMRRHLDKLNCFVSRVWNCLSEEKVGTLPLKLDLAEL